MELGARARRDRANGALFGFLLDILHQVSSGNPSQLYTSSLARERLTKWWQKSEFSRARSLPFLYKSYLPTLWYESGGESAANRPAKRISIIATLGRLFLLPCMKIFSNAGPDGKRRAFTMETDSHHQVRCRIRKISHQGSLQVERVKWKRLRSAPQAELAGLPAATKDLPWRTCVIDAIMDPEVQVAIRKS